MRKSFLLRIDPKLWSDLEAWAEEELRSVNGQIEYLLKQAVRRRQGALAPGGTEDNRPVAPSPGKSKDQGDGTT